MGIFQCERPTVSKPAMYRKVYWHHFWNRQQATKVHLFRVVGVGYSERGPDEGNSLCGEQIGDDYHEVEDYPDKWCCKKCLRAQAKVNRTATTPHKTHYRVCLEQAEEQAKRWVDFCKSKARGDGANVTDISSTSTSAPMMQKHWSASIRRSQNEQTCGFRTLCATS